MGQLVSIAHFMTSNIFFLKRTQHLNCLYMSIDLVFVLKWVKILLDACSIYSISLVCLYLSDFFCTIQMIQL